MASVGLSSGSAVGAVSLRDYLAGHWTLERTVTDQRAAWCGTLSGWLEMAPDGEALHYREAGRLTLPQGAFQTSRTLRFCFPTTQLAQVRFADGRLFHDLALGTSPWHVTHHCGRDVYSGCFRRLDRDRWCVSWRVVGPRKRQQIDSCFRRA